MAGSGPLAFTATLLTLIQIGGAVAIAILVRQALWSFVGGWSWSPSWLSKTSTQNVCLMTNGSVNLCAFSYVIVAVGLAASTAALLAQCFSRSGRRTGRCCVSMDLCLAVVLAPVWVAAAVTAMVYGMRADDAGLPEHAARTAVWALAWAEAGLWILSGLVAALSRRSHRLSEMELTASLAGGSNYSRYSDTPFNDRTSKWREAKANYLSARSLDRTAAKQLEP